MSSRRTTDVPPRELYQLVTEGTNLTLTPTGGSGSLGITLPKTELRKRGLVSGDEVMLLPDEEPDTFKLYLPPNDA